MYYYPDVFFFFFIINFWFDCNFFFLFQGLHWAKSRRNLCIKKKRIWRKFFFCAETYLPNLEEFYYWNSGKLPPITLLKTKVGAGKKKKQRRGGPESDLCFSEINKSTETAHFPRKNCPGRYRRGKCVRACKRRILLHGA